MQRDPRACLWDVRQAAAAITEFTAGIDAAGYRASPLIRSAVERQFEIIGEALNRLLKEAPSSPAVQAQWIECTVTQLNALAP